MCLKMVIKRARGQHGREAATGVTDYKTWDAFENDVALIWKNAQEYNEDGSDMYELSKKFKVCLSDILDCHHLTMPCTGRLSHSTC